MKKHLPTQHRKFPSLKDDLASVFLVDHPWVQNTSWCSQKIEVKYEVADFCASCEEIYACSKMKWSLSSSSCEITWCGHFRIYYVWRILWSSTRTNGQRKDLPPVPGVFGKSWKLDSKAIPPKKGGDGGSQKRPFLLATFGEKIPRGVNLRVIKNETRWKLRSMIKVLCLKGDTSTNACFLIVMLVFGRVVSGWTQTLYEHCTSLQTKNDKTDICATYWYSPQKYI